MRLNKYIFPTILLAAILTSCGEDRTHEYLEKTEENQWILSQMQSDYLWNDSITIPKRKDFFGSSSIFFYNLLYKSDNSSYMTDSAAATSYGMSFAIIRDPLATSTNKSYALVLFVEPKSPAERAGVKRGTWISKVGSHNVTSGNAGYLERGNATKLVTWQIELDTESMEYIWSANDTLSMESATATENPPLYLDSIYNVRNHKVGYIVYNRFTPHAQSNDITNVLSQFAGQGVTDLILDLRYNSGGSAQEAARIASHFVPATMQGDTFCRIVHNSDNSDKNITYSYSSVTPFETGMIYILTTAATRGTAEAFAASLQQTLGRDKVLIVGENSAGDNIYTQTYTSPYNFTISPAVGELHTADGNLLSPYGQHANYIVNELSQFHRLYELGEEQEYLLYNTFYLIVNGTLPYLPNETDAIAPQIDTHIRKGKSITK